MEIPIYQVDAFASRAFEGNPAAICPLESWLPDATMQALAMENNLAETAYFVKTGDRYHLRWFTPAIEIDLCGHATLASAWLILNRLEPQRNEVRFDTKSGELVVTRDGNRLSMDFPARPPQPVQPWPKLAAAVGGKPREILAARDYLLVYETGQEVLDLRPDFNTLLDSDRLVIVTGPGSDGIDFVSRFFAPAAGINEDPVTGSAHCTLIPYWAERLGKTSLRARQVSQRGGDLWCRHLGERVTMAGHAVLVLEGKVLLP